MIRRYAIVENENFLHSHPSLYDAFEPDQEFVMGRFILGLLKHYHISGTILDVGSGLGREAKYLSQNGYEVVGVDNTDEMIAWARENVTEATFYKADQREFELDYVFDAAYSVGSTFLYNYMNEDAIQTLTCIRKHLKKDGLLYLDMRNAMFFVTPDGRKWLSEELQEEVFVEGERYRLYTQFSMDYRNQLLHRDYRWELGKLGSKKEHLIHRLYFPKEMEYLLQTCGFRVKEIFDYPAPHIKSLEGEDKISFHNEMDGRRMQIIAFAE